MTIRWKSLFTRRKKWLTTGFILCMLILCLFINYSHLTCASNTSLTPSQWNKGSRDIRFVTVFSDSSEPKSGKKLILLWTPFFTSVVWDADHDVFQDCPVSKCEVTTNRFHLMTSDAVLFNVRDLSEITTNPLPASRTRHQVWVLHNTEPPYYSYLPLQNYAGVFNWTSWYRRDATIYSPYGQWRSLSQKEKLEENGYYNYLQNKTKMVLWVSSNCYDKANRITFVRELRNYIDIDTYGKCGDLKCNRREQNCREIFARYKFYLSFENGFCRDYITEKFWRPVIRNQIPVVRGGSDYESLVPPGSYINVDDFQDIPSLAAYLHKVAENETLYNSYFAWRKSYKLVPNGWTRMNWCGLCERLHDANQPSQVYIDLKGWVQQDLCNLPCHSTMR